MEKKLSISDRVFYGFTALCIPALLYAAATPGTPLSNALLLTMGAVWAVFIANLVWKFAKMAVTGKFTF